MAIRSADMFKLSLPLSCIQVKMSDGPQNDWLNCSAASFWHVVDFALLTLYPWHRHRTSAQQKTVVFYYLFVISLKMSYDCTYNGLFSWPLDSTFRVISKELLQHFLKKEGIQTKILKGNSANQAELCVAISRMRDIQGSHHKALIWRPVTSAQRAGDE